MTAVQGIDARNFRQVVENLPFDSFEVGLLTVSRHFLDVMRCPETQAWHLAYSIAAERWGDRIGLPTAHLLARFLKYVVQCREDNFDHTDPFCEQSCGLATADEIALLYVLHFMRHDNSAAARNAVEELTQGRLDPDVIRAGLTFANRFPAGASPNEIATKGVRLEVVS